MILHQNLTSSYFLKVSSNVGLWIHINELLYSITVKSNGLFYTSNGFLPMQDFVTSCFGSFQKYWACRSCKCWHILLYNTKISHSLISPQISIKKSWEAIKLNVTDANSQKSNFHLKGQISSLATNLVRFFFFFFKLKRHVPFVPVWENLCQIPNSKITVACQSFLQVKIFHLKKWLAQNAM